MRKKSLLFAELLFLPPQFVKDFRLNRVVTMNALTVLCMVHKTMIMDLSDKLHVRI